MRTRFRWLIVIVGVAISVGRGRVTGDQAPAWSGVSGIVLTTEDPQRPVRRAIVSLRGKGRALGHHAITDDDGRFEIKELPAGSYDVAAKRPAFVTIAHGASKPEMAGTPLTVALGQHLSGVTLRLTPGAVITGTVRDDSGAPAALLEVHVQRPIATGGTFAQRARTDRQGVYRFYGLAAGAYLVSVRPLTSGTAVSYATSDAEVDAILAQLRQGNYGTPQLQPGRPAAARHTVSDFAPIFYGNSFTIQGATPVNVAAGDERSGIDFTIRR